MRYFFNIRVKNKFSGAIASKFNVIEENQLLIIGKTNATAHKQKDSMCAGG
jgi:hypothetical protein